MNWYVGIIVLAAVVVIALLFVMSLCNASAQADEAMGHRPPTESELSKLMRK